MSDVQIANIIGKADTDGSGTIDFDEFCASNETKLAEDMFKVCTIIQLYHFSFNLSLSQKYDKNGDGFLGPDEVVLLAKDLGCGNITIPQAKRLIASVDKNGDGKISFEGKIVQLMICAGGIICYIFSILEFKTLNTK